LADLKADEEALRGELIARKVESAEGDLGILLAVTMGPQTTVAEYQGARRVLEIMLAAMPCVPAKGGAT
jgi:hypothetical protein